VKFDFLGLTTLSILAKAVELIDKLYPEQQFRVRPSNGLASRMISLYSSSRSIASLNSGTSAIASSREMFRPRLHGDKLRERIRLHIWDV